MPWNTKKVQEAIYNGAAIDPGATHVKVINHMYKLLVDPRKCRAIPKQLPASRGSISHPGKDSKREFESKVYIYMLKMETLYWSKDRAWKSHSWPVLGMCSFRGHTSLIASQRARAIGHLQNVWWPRNCDQTPSKDAYLWGSRAPPHCVPDDTFAVRCPARYAHRRAVVRLPCKLVRASNRENSSAIRCPRQHILSMVRRGLDLHYLINVHGREVALEDIHSPFAILCEQLSHST